MLSSTKANLRRRLRFYAHLFNAILLTSGIALAGTKEKAFSQFPPEPLKFIRDKKDLKLLLQEEPSAQDMPFWRSKKNIHRKMLEERLIPVSVNQSKLSGGLIAFDVKGAGIVHSAREGAFKTAQEYAKLTQVSSHFKSAYYDEKNKQLFLAVEALGYETRMILAIDLVAQKKRSEIQFEVVWGELKGMTGAIGFENLNDESCEVSILSHYQATQFPLPKIFMGFAFEVLTQKVAEKMRSFIESER